MRNFADLSDEEIGIVRKWRNNKNIKKWMFQDHTISPKEHLKYMTVIKKDNKNFCWLIKDSSGEYLGVISLNRVDYRNKNSYLAVYSNPFLKKSGFGRMALKIIVSLAFGILKLHTLKLEVLDNNIAAKKLYRKFGFIKEGELREFVFRGGKWQDVVIMGITNGDIRQLC